jgi:ABC-2 type transport system ATP-binding protein
VTLTESGVPAIETIGLTKGFGSIRAVEHLDLCVEPAEIFGFLGPNGAGKTTTIRALLDLHRPTTGTARVFGLDTHLESVAVHRRTGYLPGELCLFDRMTAAEHIAWFARARGMSETGRADELAERFGLNLDQRVKDLSKGNRQKVGIVLAFLHDPDVLILDEPTSGLDPLMKDEFERLLREASASGRTIFLSSHDLDEVQRVADRVGIIKEGRLIRVDTVEGLRQNAPRIFELSLRMPADPKPFEAAGARVLSSDGLILTLAVPGDIGPILRIAADLDPVDLVSRHADLDELFLSFYRTDQGSEVDDAG